MSKIIIAKAEATPRKVNSRDGKTSYIFVEQQAALLRDGEHFPTPFRLRLGDDDKPYPAGEYTIDLNSCQIGQYGDLQVGRRIQLIPVAAAPAASAIATK